ncbi:hypothetical protein K443DRAFT_676152 [Laccaria amethystina LaAM-08-1]|uniref:Uncharacterized protein n=1 Tax=Laccaria amethystina LaAM-08-1 TaxID=1095629 RepID=A0A0C9XGV6_9AGAR|nr:hypothetical protein K443DRAFT_676152 [Laccaria amethystina LaAM-08-1]
MRFVKAEEGIEDGCAPRTVSPRFYEGLNTVAMKQGGDDGWVLLMVSMRWPQAMSRCRGVARAN